MFQLCKEPTHRRILQKPSTIDLILTNNDFCSQIEYLPPLGKSHHSVLEFKLAMSKSQITNTCKTDKYIIDKADFDGMRHYIKQLNLEKAFLNSKDLSVEDSWKIINNAILDARDKYVPKVTFSNNKKSNNKDPLPQYILLKIKTKRRLFKIYNKYPTQDNYNSYARARNQVKWETRKFIVNKEKTLAKDVKLNPKRFYQYISSKHKVNDPVADLIKPDGSLTNSDDEKAEVLNNFFSSIFINENNDTLPDFNCGKDISLDNVTVTKEHMLKKLLSLNASKSPGPDGIHPRQLKELAHELAAPLTILFETCMHEGKVPMSWKLAEDKPIFIKGDKTDPGNYRPISLVCVICKVFESFIRDALCEHLDRHNLLSIEQFGFTKGRSCTTQLLVTVGDWMNSLDNGTSVDAIYLDFSKAFDRVPHMRLLKKLKGYGISENVNWLSYFVSDRQQYVSINKASSKNILVTSGVPQGSVIGPILFIYYINDLPMQTNNSTIKIFADDTKLYSEISSKSDSDSLQNDLNNLVIWTNTWLLNFNLNKCCVMHLGKDNPNYNYTLLNDNSVIPINPTLSEKDLGVYIDPLLGFDNHIDIVVKKANKVCGLIIRSITHNSSDILIPLFK